MSDFILQEHSERRKYSPSCFTLLYTEFSTENVKINVYKSVVVNCFSFFSYAKLTTVGIVEVMFEIKRRESSMRSNFAPSDCTAGNLLTEKFAFKAGQFLRNHTLAQIRSTHRSRAACCPRHRVMLPAEIF